MSDHYAALIQDGVGDLAHIFHVGIMRSICGRHVKSKVVGPLKFDDKAREIVRQDDDLESQFCGDCLRGYDSRTRQQRVRAEMRAMLAEVRS